MRSTQFPQQPWRRGVLHISEKSEMGLRGEIRLPEIMQLQEAMALLVHEFILWAGVYLEPRSNKKGVSGYKPACQRRRHKRCTFDPWLRKIPPGGGGNGNPLQCSCLEDPRDRGAWLAAVHRVAKSRTQLSGHEKQWKEPAWLQRPSVPLGLSSRWGKSCWLLHGIMKN